MSIESYYAKRAYEYEAVYAKPERQADLAALRGLVPGYFKGCKVLEVACGTGYWTQVVAAQAASVWAADVNQSMLDIARSKHFARRNVEFVIDDAYTLNACPGGFSAALAAFWWSHLPRQRTAEFLQALHDKLLPGARVMILDNRYVAGSSTPIRFMRWRRSV